MEPAQGYYNSFVVKIWRDEAEGTMRGHIRHVGTQNYVHFDNLANMDRFILNHLGSSTGDPISWGTAGTGSAAPTDYPGGTSASS